MPETAGACAESTLGHGEVHCPAEPGDETAGGQGSRSKRKTIACFYARHGCSFKKRGSRADFDAKDWYLPMPMNVAAPLKPLEKKNEARRASGETFRRRAAENSPRRDAQDQMVPRAMCHRPRNSAAAANR